MENERVIEKLANMEQKLVSAEHRIKNLEDAQKENKDLTISVKELAMSMRNMTEEMKEQGLRIKALEEEPANKWKSMEKQIFNTIVSVLFGAVASGLLLIMTHTI